MSRDARKFAFYFATVFSFFLMVAHEVRAQCGSLSREDGDPGFLLGKTVSTYGDRIAVGTPHAWGGVANSGAVYVFRPHFGVWIQEAKLLPPAPTQNYYMGQVISLNGSWLFAGVSNDETNGHQSGAVHVFRRSGTSWSFVTTLTPSDAIVGQNFGLSVAIDDSWAVVGAYGGNYIFRYDGANWVEDSKLISSSDGVDFGTSIAIDNDTIVVGAPSAPGPFFGITGAAYVFRLTGGVWVEEAKLTAPNIPVHGLGTTVALSGNVAVLLQNQRDEAYVFERQVGTWQFRDTLVSDDEDPMESASISGDLIVTGSQTFYPPGDSTGVTYVFSRVGDTWVRVSKMSFESPTVLGFGSSVAATDNQFVVGTHQSSFAYVYLTNPPVTDCNYNCVADTTEFQTSSALDCNANGILDGCDLAACDGSQSCGDCDDNGIPDGCDLADCAGDSHCSDCNLNGAMDACDIASANGNVSLSDCNLNGRPDACDIASGAADVNFNSIPDACECTLFDTMTELTSSDFNQSRLVSATLDRIVVSGPVRVFHQVGDNWIEKLTLEDNGFGVIDGDVLLAPQASGIDVYHYDGATWQFESNIAIMGVQGLALKGDRAIAATPFYTPSGWQGSAKILRKDPGGWVEEATLIPADGQPGDNFAYSVAIDEDRVVVGAVGHIHGPSNGVAYVFRREGTNWVEEEKIVPGSGSSFFGRSVAIEGQTLVIGSTVNVVHSYHLVGNDWIEEPNLTPIFTFGQTDSLFGYSLSMRDGALLVGSPAQPGVPDGTVHHYHRDGFEWNPVRRYLPPPTVDRRYFGFTVAVGGNAAAVGCDNFPAFAFTDLTPDCDGNGQIDLCQITASLSPDCNTNDLPDACDIESGVSADATNDGIPDECQCVPISCADNNVCTHDSCMVGQVCNHAVLATLKFGDVNNDSAVNLDDILCENAGFSGHFTVACPLERVDLVPCPANDGIVTLDDILAVLKAFGGGVSAGCTADLCAP